MLPTVARYRSVAARRPASQASAEAWSSWSAEGRCPRSWRTSWRPCCSMVRRTAAEATCCTWSSDMCGAAWSSRSGQPSRRPSSRCVRATRRTSTPSPWAVCATAVRGRGADRAAVASAISACWRPTDRRGLDRQRRRAHHHRPRDAPQRHRRPVKQHLAPRGAEGIGDGLLGILRRDLLDAEAEDRHLDAVVEGHGLHDVSFSVGGRTAGDARADCASPTSTGIGSPRSSPTPLAGS
jgi:hypothetical protein